MCNVIKHFVPFSTSPLVCIHKHTQKEQWQGMADWRHVQITCSISENHVAEIQLHPSTTNVIYLSTHKQKSSQFLQDRAGTGLSTDGKPHESSKTV